MLEFLIIPLTIYLIMNLCKLELNSPGLKVYQKQNGFLKLIYKVYLTKNKDMTVDIFNDKTFLGLRVKTKNCVGIFLLNKLAHDGNEVFECGDLQTFNCSRSKNLTIILSFLKYLTNNHTYCFHSEVLGNIFSKLICILYSG